MARPLGTGRSPPSDGLFSTRTRSLPGFAGQQRRRAAAVEVERVVRAELGHHPAISVSVTPRLSTCRPSTVTRNILRPSALEPDRGAGRAGWRPAMSCGTPSRTRPVAADRGVQRAAVRGPRGVPARRPGRRDAGRRGRPRRLPGRAGRWCRPGSAPLPAVSATVATRPPDQGHLGHPGGARHGPAARVRRPTAR